MCNFLVPYSYELSYKRSQSHMTRCSSQSFIITHLSFEKWLSLPGNLSPFQVQWSLVSHTRSWSRLMSGSLATGILILLKHHWSTFVLSSTAATRAHLPAKPGLLTQGPQFNCNLLSRIKAVEEWYRDCLENNTHTASIDDQYMQ